MRQRTVSWPRDMANRWAQMAAWRLLPPRVRQTRHVESKIQPAGPDSRSDPVSRERLRKPSSATTRLTRVPLACLSITEARLHQARLGGSAWRPRQTIARNSTSQTAPLQKFVNQSPSRVPLTDWYSTTDGKQSGFQARSVVGGVYIPFFANPDLWKKWSSKALAPEKTLNRQTWHEPFIRGYVHLQFEIMSSWKADERQGSTLMKRHTKRDTKTLLVTVLVLLLSSAWIKAHAQRWSEAQANAWYRSNLKLASGGNYVPMNAINQLEMWQFRRRLIRNRSTERWAGQKGLGMNTTRVFLHDLLWQQDVSGFKQRNRYLPDHRGQAS